MYLLFDRKIHFDSSSTITKIVRCAFFKTFINKDMGNLKKKQTTQVDGWQQQFSTILFSTNFYFIKEHSSS